MDVDGLIQRLLKMRSEKPEHAGGEDKKPEKEIPMTAKEITTLCHLAREIFLSQPMLLEIDPPVNICGDIHGQFFDLLRVFEYGGYPPTSNYLFLGDYVDRGIHSLETICLLLSYKVKYPNQFFLLRGNHESADVNRTYGFYDDCKRRFSIKLWKTFTDCFNCIPVSALVGGKILCMHGGISPELHSLDLIRRIKRPTEVPDSGVLCDILWADPNRDNPSNPGWSENSRGVSYVFGAEVVKAFNKKFNLDLVCRAHEVVEDGYEFFADKNLITLFSAPNYTGGMDNAAAFMSVNKDLVCSLRVLKPSSDGKNYKYGKL